MGPPVTQWESPEGNCRAAGCELGSWRVHLGPIFLMRGCDWSGDGAVSRKQGKYRPLVQALKRAGWNVEWRQCMWSQWESGGRCRWPTIGQS
eukprot:1180159-Prorocentrum_minimum.AAC.6